MLSFLPNQICIGIDDILLNFFATFGSLLGLQVTVLIRLSQIRWYCLLCLFNVEPCLWPEKHICSTAYIVIKITELVGRTLIQSIFLTHHCQGRNEVSWRLGQEAYWRPMFEPKVFRSKSTILKKVGPLVTLLGILGAPRSHSATLNDNLRHNSNRDSPFN